MPTRVRGIDEAAKIVGRAVQARRREEIDAVVTPAEAAGEIRHGHDFDHRDAELGERGELARRRAPRSFARERADVQLVNDLPSRDRPRQSRSFQSNPAGSTTCDGPCGPSG